MERFKPQNESSDQTAVSIALEQLQYAADILRDMGLEVIDKFITKDRLVLGVPFPIVRDGLDGIRVVYSRQHGLKIWFTNGFEDPANLKRKEIEQRLRAAGLF